MWRHSDGQWSPSKVEGRCGVRAWGGGEAILFSLKVHLDVKKFGYCKGLRCFMGILVAIHMPEGEGTPEIGAERPDCTQQVLLGIQTPAIIKCSSNFSLGLLPITVDV